MRESPKGIVRNTEGRHHAVLVRRTSRSVVLTARVAVVKDYVHGLKVDHTEMSNAESLIVALKVACRSRSASAARVLMTAVRSRAAHVRKLARHSIAKARRRVEMRGHVVRARSLTAIMARATRRSMAMSVVVKVRRLSVTGVASDSAD